MESKRRVFVTGGTGYLGSRLIPRLVERGHLVRALARPGSERRLPPGCETVTGDALNKESFAPAVREMNTFVQLVGVAHPSPAKARQFREIDLVSMRESVAAASEAEVSHFVYLSVAQPAPVMKAYVAVRGEGEEILRKSGIGWTILRPWYVLGPGHRWAYALKPLYWVSKRVPQWRESARRMDLVTCEQMLEALVDAVELPSKENRLWEVPAIQNRELRAAGASRSTEGALV